MDFLLFVILIGCALPESEAACDIATYTSCITNLNNDIQNAQVSNDVTRLCSLADSYQSSAQGCLTHIEDCDQTTYDTFARTMVDPTESLGSLCGDNQQSTNTGLDDCVITVGIELLGCVDDLSSFTDLASQLGTLEYSGQSIESYCSLVEDGSLREILACMAPLFEKCPALLQGDDAGQTMDLADIDAQIALLEATCQSECPNTYQLLASAVNCFINNYVQFAEDFVADGTCSKLEAVQTCLETTLVDCKDLYGLIIATSSGSYANNDIMFLENALKNCHVTPSQGFTYFDPSSIGTANGVYVSVTIFFFSLMLTLIS